MSVRKALRCPVCNSASIEIFFEMQNIPALCNVLHATREEAVHAGRGNLQLGFCSDCGHLYNYAFDPKLISYTQAYENSLHFSPRFQRYAEGLANDLVNRFDLHNKTIIEIGCGKGDFLKVMCELGGNQGIGFDESYQPELLEQSDRFTVIRDSYSEKYSNSNADFICCRHVLEHIESPTSFVNSIRKSIGGKRDCAVYIEVPNALFTLKDLGIWDLIYEHCSYFTANSLSRLFTSCGFEVIGLEEKYDGQFLGIELLPSENKSTTSKLDIELSAIEKLILAFAENYGAKVETWKTNFAQVKGEGKRVVVWGSGSKGVTFLNVLKQTANVEYVVDINPRKQGMFVAGSGQRIVAPEFLRDYKPDVVILMNAIYQDEVKQMLAGLGVQPEFLFA